MVNFTILAGGFATMNATIVSYLFTDSPPSLTIQKRFPTGDNPSWIALSQDKSFLYAVNEVDAGTVQAFKIGPGQLDPVANVSTRGKGPTFVAQLSTGQVAAMNFGSGTALVIPTTQSPFAFDEKAARLIEFPSATSASNPHSVYEFGKEILVPDLGADTVHRLVQDGGPGQWKIQDEIKQPPGSGPRHAVVQGSTLFLLSEKSSNLSAISLAPPPKTLSTLSIIPPTPSTRTTSTFAAAEVLIPPPTAEFPETLIYASNRNISSSATSGRGDTIAIVRPVTGGKDLELVTQVQTGLRNLRSMAFSPDGKFLVVGAAVNGGGGVKVFRRIDGGKGLKEVAANTEIDTRTSFVWL